MTDRNGKIREVTDNKGQFFSCVLHSEFKLDMTFLAKGIWLSQWKTQVIYLLGSSFTDLKSYNMGKHIKVIDSMKYCQ